MSMPTQPLRDEHRELLSYVEKLLRVADMVGQVSLAPILQGVEQVYDFLVQDLIPHANAEEKILYPVIRKVLGAPEATATLIRDHVEIARLTEQLADLHAQLATEPLNQYRKNELRRLLYGLYELLRVHFAKEEEIYLPVLDARLTAEEIRQVLESMEAAIEVRGQGSVASC
jgi:iron-sulfur cluster repair protein YtfE (RIC family)